MPKPAATSVVSLDAFRTYVKAKTADPEALQGVLDAATDLLASKVYVEKIPQSLLKQATLLVAQNLWQRRQAAIEVGQIGSEGDPTPVFHRPALDPMTPAWPLLRTWKKSVGLA